MALSVRRLSGSEIGQYLDDLARLRIAVFAAWPYLYDGDLAYEADYVREFAAETGSVLVAAMDDDRVIGAATASPMTGQKPAFRAPFEDRGIDTAKLFYFGESVLLPEYRGQGLGHAFFDHREAAALEAGAEAACFASVIRPDDHRARPVDYRPLHAFWKGRGYSPIEGFVTNLAWKDMGDSEESTKSMQFYLRQFRERGE